MSAEQEHRFAALYSSRVSRMLGERLGMHRRRAVVGLLVATVALATMPSVSSAMAGPHLGQGMAQSAKARKCKKGLVREHGQCVKKEVHLAVRSCEGLLPGFSTVIGPEIATVIGSKGGIETTSHNGYSLSSCPIEVRAGGHLVKNGEGEEVFNGVEAIFVTEETWSNERGAEGQFKLKRAVAGSLEDSVLVPATGVGDEAYLWAQRPTTSTNGEQGCASSAGVRVDNIVFIYSLAGIGPEAGEACGAAALALLKDVAAGLAK